MDVQRSGAAGRRKKRHLLLAGAGMLSTVLLGWIALGLADRSPSVDSNLAWSGKVFRGEFVYEVTAAGALVATEIRAVANRSDGVVERVLVLPGQLVEPHEVLVELSSSTLPDDLSKARSMLEAAEAEERLQAAKSEEEYVDRQVTLAGFEADYTSARVESDAKQRLSVTNAVSELDVRTSALKAEQQKRRYEAAKAQLDRYPQIRAAQVAATAAKLSQLRRDVQRLEQLISELEIRAGFTGVVQTVDVEAGKRVMAGTQIARIVNPDKLIARVQVSERDASLVQLGRTARLEMGRQTLAGKVTRVEPTVQDRFVTVDISLDGVEHRGLRPDLSVTARIEIERVPDTLVLGRPAALRDEQRSIALFQLDNGRKHAKRVDVEIGRISARQIEITRGLRAGDEVILADLTEWAGEAQIRIR